MEDEGSESESEESEAEEETEEDEEENDDSKESRHLEVEEEESDAMAAQLEKIKMEAALEGERAQRAFFEAQVQKLMNKPQKSKKSEDKHTSEPANKRRKRDKQQH